MTPNTALDHVIVVHSCVAFTSWFLKMWLFPYPYGFCNPVRIYGKNINGIWYDMTYDMMIYDIYDIWHDIWYMTIYDIWHDTIWYDMIYMIWWYMLWWYMLWWYMTWHMIYDMIYDIWHIWRYMIYDIYDMIYDMIWHDIYDMIGYDIYDMFSKYRSVVQDFPVLRHMIKNPHVCGPHEFLMMTMTEC